MSSNRPTVFLDFDDTLSDPIPFFLQFVHEISTLFCARFGGDAQEWERVATHMLVYVEDGYKARFIGTPRNGYLEWLHSLPMVTMGLMFGGMEIPIPHDAASLSSTIQFEALKRCNVAFPGVDRSLKALSAQGYHLHMASGQESNYLRGALTGMEILSHFDRLFGPDLIDCAKEGLEYYQRVFAAVGVSSSEVIIVDDYPPAIGWALESGAKVIQVKLSPIRHEQTIAGVSAVVTDFHLLPEAVQKIANSMN